MGWEHLVCVDIIKTFKIQDFQTDYAIEMDQYKSVLYWGVVVGHDQPWTELR